MNIEKKESQATRAHQFLLPAPSSLGAAPSYNNRLLHTTATIGSHRDCLTTANYSSHCLPPAASIPMHHTTRQKDKLCYS